MNVTVEKVKALLLESHDRAPDNYLRQAIYAKISLVAEFLLKETNADVNSGKACMSLACMNSTL